MPVGDLVWRWLDSAKTNKIEKSKSNAERGKFKAGIMVEASWSRHLVEASLRRHLEEPLWRRHLWRRPHAGGIMEEASWGHQESILRGL